MSRLTRWRFYFERQQGRCYLRRTDGCKHRDGMLTPYRAKGGYCGDEAITWDHIYPRTDARRAGAGTLVLLACYACNHARGVRPATEAHIAAATAARQAWLTAFAAQCGTGAKAARRSQRKQQRALVRAMQCEAGA